MRDARSRQEAVFVSRLEDTVADTLLRLGFEFRRHAKAAGVATRHQWDFVLSGRRMLIEVDGCYWHSCEACGYDDERGQRVRDAMLTREAVDAGWVVLRAAEHDLVSRGPFFVVELLREQLKRTAA
jgi:very-short-patch-repair endonuclease